MLGHQTMMFQSPAGHASRPLSRQAARSATAFHMLNGLALAIAVLSAASAVFLAYETGVAAASVLGSDAHYQRVRHFAAHSCHQDPSRCFWIAGRPLPICARCLGIRVGVVVGLVGSIRLRRRIVAVIAVLSLLAFADIGLKPLGIDSPNVWRLIAGMALGSLAATLCVCCVRLLWHSPRRWTYDHAIGKWQRLIA